MSAQVSPSVIRQRCGLLRELDKAKRLTFLQQFLGEMRQVLVENRRDEASSMRCGFTDNYLPVLVPPDAALENQIVMAKLRRVEGAKLVAIPV
jgi:threonylcarbamoyladenosine tRNA methylthiotransferase MtaB